MLSRFISYAGTGKKNKSLVTLVSIFIVLLFLQGTNHANADNISGLKTTDKTGCHITNGDLVTPTISLMTAAYDEHSAIRSRVVLLIIKIAIKYGCPVDKEDDAGLTPLNASILFNEPGLVEFFLKSGANPGRKMVKAGEKYKDFNSYSFFEYMKEKDRSTDRTKVGTVLLQYEDNSF